MLFFSSRRRHTRLQGDWSSDVCSSDLESSQKRVKDRISSLHSKIAETREEFEISHKQHQQVLTDLARVSAELEELREENLKLEHGRGLRAGALEWISKVTDLLRTQLNVLTVLQQKARDEDRKSTRLNSSHLVI